MAGTSHEWNPLKHLSEKNESRHELHIPMVYEQIQNEQTRWEYHVLSVDLSEAEAPDVKTLNELGSQGWLLVSTVSQPDRRAVVHYYFVRQQLG